MVKRVADMHNEHRDVMSWMSCPHASRCVGNRRRGRSGAGRFSARGVASVTASEGVAGVLVVLNREGRNIITTYNRA